MALLFRPHPVGRAVARGFRQLLAVLALHGGEETAQVGQRPPARLDLPEPRREPRDCWSRAPAPPAASLTSVMLGTSSRTRRPNPGCGTDSTASQDGERRRWLAGPRAA